MDLSQFDTREKADEGVSFSLEIGGTVVIGDDGEPVTFSVRGMNAPDVQAHFLKTKDQEPPRTTKEVEARDMELMRLAVNGWSNNFEVKGQKYPFSQKNIAAVCSVPVIRGFIASKIIEARAFMNGSESEPVSESDN